jgi:epoxyqueuosine reductase
MPESARLHSGGYNPRRMALELHELAGRIKGMARELGFDLAGITSARPSAYRDYFRQWLDDGKAGTMDWLRRRFDERVDPAVYFPGVKSVVCVAVNYYVTLEPAKGNASGATGRVARYALGNDYHDWIKQRLHSLADWMRQATGCRTRCGVDTAPIMEKELAARAGIGWLGKNSCVIHERQGSWLFLGEVLTDLELPPDEPAVDRCGTCRRCIDACPTAAITAPYQLDATRCISYLTIEHDGAIDPALQARMGDWLFGCDICQDVCPFNGRPTSATDADVQPRLPDGRVNLADLLAWDANRYRREFHNSAVRRVSLPVLQRNAATALANQSR